MPGSHLPESSLADLDAEKAELERLREAIVQLLGRCLVPAWVEHRDLAVTLRGKLLRGVREAGSDSDALRDYLCALRLWCREERERLEASTVGAAPGGRRAPSSAALLLRFANASLAATLDGQSGQRRSPG